MFGLGDRVWAGEPIEIEVNKFYIDFNEIPLSCMHVDLLSILNLLIIAYYIVSMHE